MRANRTQHVYALHAAIAPASGLQTFFEPAGHLTNGSFVREFAELFSESITETKVVVVAVTELEPFLSKASKTLIKIDVEGFEPVLVASLGNLIQKYQPDLLIEVLEGTAEKLEQTIDLVGYRRFLITSQGLQEARSLFACSSYRDWLLLYDQTSSPVKSRISASQNAALPV
jgi:FkbM family methyltransferase